METWYLLMRPGRRDLTEAIVAFVVAMTVTWGILASGALSPLGIPPVSGL